ncbi:hypothetical protein MNBD_GAMMA11-444 [hydrothermal vent metagenome]|uniref:Uncharacterized protein n=1 Tax=hydrothermal vent metagenome TaxID=652676 RepID=A0A3B0X7D1_9ZZZZ
MKDIFCEVREGNARKLIQWLGEGGDIENARQPHNETLLMQACMNGHARLTTMLLDAGANILARSNTARLPVTYAAQSGDYDTVMLFLNRGYGINDDISGCNNNETFLFWAVCQPSYFLVHYLIKMGADVNARNHDNVTALINSADAGELEICKLLINKNAAINALDNNGNSPLNRAIDKGHLCIRKLLIEKGANIAGLLSASVPEKREIADTEA